MTSAFECCHYKFEVHFKSFFFISRWRLFNIGRLFILLLLYKYYFLISEQCCQLYKYFIGILCFNIVKVQKGIIPKLLQTLTAIFKKRFRLILFLFFVFFWVILCSLGGILTNVARLNSTSVVKWNGMMDFSNWWKLTTKVSVKQPLKV